MSSSPSDLLRQARSRAGLSQRQLASAAGTSQSVVARIELGETSPTWDTLQRLLSAAGLDLDIRLIPVPPTGSHMLEDVARILRLTPEDRLKEVANASGFLAEARRG